MAKKSSKAAPGQKGLTNEFTTIPRQARIAFETAGENQGTLEYKTFVPGPNPELPEFIRKHGTPFDAKNDDYDVPAFNCDIIVDKARHPGRSTKCIATGQRNTGQQFANTSATTFLRSTIPEVQDLFSIVFPDRE